MNYNYFPRKFYYMNAETGVLLTRAEMLAEAEQEYGFDEFTPASELWEYYELTEIAVD